MKTVKVLALTESIQKDEIRVEFDRPIDEAMQSGLLKYGLQSAAYQASSCMGWVWRQWLLAASNVRYSEKVRQVVDRGLELRKRSRSYDYLPQHDLYLLHCAIFASTDSQLMAVAEQVADTAGDKGSSPADDGQLYVAAWCGMMKYWILNNQEKAAQQAELIWGAYREPGVFAAPKTLVAPWLKRDWKAFAKAQTKDFEKLWNRARKDGWTVKTENETEIVVTTERYQIEHQWCWAHCGMAMLAHRNGADVISDPFWFPQSAITAPVEHVRN